MNIRLFGAFRNLQSEPELTIDLPEEVQTIGQLRAQLASRFTAVAASGGPISKAGHGTNRPDFDAVGLLAKSAIANDREVLSDDAVFSRTDRLAILPPVSGG